MAKTWELEKAYCARRAEALGAEMDAAIEEVYVLHALAAQSGAGENRLRRAMPAPITTGD